MSAQEASNITIITVVLGTIWLIVYWRLVHKPMTEGPADGTHLGFKKRPVTEAGVRIAATLMAFLGAVTNLAVFAYGYQWFFGVAGYCVFCIAIAWMWDLRHYPARFRGRMKLIACACVPFAVALGLAWAKPDFSRIVFHVLCGAATWTLAYSSYARIPER